MNWVDIIIILLLIFFALEGYRRSFIGEFVYFLSFLLAFIFSLRFYNLLAIFYSSQFGLPHSLSNVLGFVSVWFLTELLLFPLFQLLLPRLKFLERIDTYLRPFSVIPSFFRGLIFISILLVLVGTFPVQPTIKVAVQSSKVGSFIFNKASGLEGPLKTVFGGIAQDTLTFLTIKPKSDASINLGFQVSNYVPRSDLEDGMIILVNKERKQKGLKELIYDQKLRDVARVHSGDMFDRGYFSHYSIEGKTVADRAKAMEVKYLVIGENLAYAPNLELAHNGLMNSPGHRANILSPEYSKVGIGLMDGGAYGLMITQVFSD